WHPKNKLRWDANTGFCAGDPNNGYFEIYTTTNGGTNWTRVAQNQIPNPIANDEYGVTGFFSVVGDTVWFTTNKSRLFRSLDKGLSWTVITTPVGNNQVKVFFKDANNGIIFDNQSTPVKLYESSNGGDNWTEIFFTGPLFSLDICYVPGTSNTMISTGNADGVSYSYDGGHTWQMFQYPTGLNFLTVRFFSPNLGWAGDFTIDSFTGGINKFEGNMQPLSDDVGVFSIDMPEVIEPGNYIPKVTFKNYGTNSQSFDVSLNISGGYSSIKQVSNLQASQSVQVEFDTWTATYGNYDVSVVTLLSGDQMATNDALSMNVEVMDITDAYCYVAYDASGSLPQGPGKIFLEAPGVVISIADQTGESFIASGTWGPDNKWYGGVYYDSQTSTGGELITLDPQTGARTIIGNMGTSPVHGMSYDFTNSTMYAVTFDGTTSILNTIDLQTGILTQVGLTNSEILINLACSAQGELYAVDLVNDMFGSLDKTTGQFTSLFAIGFDASFAQDMEFDRYSDTCYLAGYDGTAQQGVFYMIDVSSSTVTLIDTISGGAEITGFAIPYVTGINVEEMPNQVSLKLYPNPSGNCLNIVSEVMMQHLRVYDNQGRVVQSENLQNSFYKVDLQNLQKGVYIIEIFTETGIIKKKFTKL
ncbi:MAG: T9SS type A sorting domain-containing protein, partial [Bacteroidota bacterium]|nr:T9SS type A sorting domain-containing protein [Bacteroidota bacterium]